jgi:hypothetical protein
MADIGGIPAIVNSSRFRTVAAYNAFVTSALGLFGFQDVWRTQSGNPCVFCRAMADISQAVFIPPGGHFPIPDFSIMEYISGLSLTYVENPPAHENCQCIRITIPRP